MQSEIQRQKNERVLQRALGVRAPTVAGGQLSAASGLSVRRGEPFDAIELDLSLLWEQPQTDQSR